MCTNISLTTKKAICAAGTSDQVLRGRKSRASLHRGLIDDVCPLPHFSNQLPCHFCPWGQQRQSFQCWAPLTLEQILAFCLSEGVPSLFPSREGLIKLNKGCYLSPVFLPVILAFSSQALPMLLKCWQFGPGTHCIKISWGAWGHWRPGTVTDLLR